MKRFLSLLLVTVVISSLCGCSSTGGKNAISSLSSEPAVTSLMQTAGVTADQAIGGLGSILSLAKSKVTPEDYSKLAAGLPSADKYIGALGGLGINSGDIKTPLDLQAAYKKLGMNDDVQQKFTPAAVNYLRSAGGEAAASVLSSLGL
jgi:Protein of unknown function VcgC/VcgE (DUF2780)